MSDKSNINAFTDGAIIEMIGRYIRQQRLEKNKTQSQLAQDAGINRTTLIELESGRSVNLLTFIQILRALNLLHTLEQFEFRPQLSPLQLAELQLNYRKRASKATPKKPKPKSDW
jgi:transcriptional regulator with XRE-family HTH domain